MKLQNLNFLFNFKIIEFITCLYLKFIAVLLQFLLIKVQIIRFLSVIYQVIITIKKFIYFLYLKTVLTINFIHKFLKILKFIVINVLLCFKAVKFALLFLNKVKNYFIHLHFKFIRLIH